MNTSRWDSAESVITIRISKAEQQELEKWVNELNYQNPRYRNKITVSKLARHIIRYCLNYKDTIQNIEYE